MNIVFVYNDASALPANSCSWRGEMFFKAIQKTGLHNVEFVGFTNFSNLSKNNVASYFSTQLFIIEGSPEIDLLTIINFWKSRGKKVVVDIPISLERICSNHIQPSKNSFFFTQMYNNIQNQDSAKLDQSDKFRWGLHLADCILVSSLQQQSQWQVTAPVRTIPEFVDIEIIRDTVKYNHDPFVIGLISNSPSMDVLLQSVMDSVEINNAHVKWLPIFGNHLLSNKNPDSIISVLPTGLSSRWPDPISFVDLGIFWDVHLIRGEFYRTILEFMALKIPWVLNDQKSYQDLSKYGLIINNENNWQQSLNEIIQKTILHISESEEGYLYAIGQNIEDHVHEILSTFSEIIKIPS